ncbi:MAG: TIGR02300 family protein [Micropepsaceae bacterium]
MAAPDIGTKRICPSCAAKFYDLSKKPIVCPKCAFSFTAEAIVKMRRPRSSASVIRDADEGAVRVKEARDDTDDAEDTETAVESEEEEPEAEEEIKEVALDDETVADPDLVEDEEAEDKDDKPEVVGDEVDLEEIEDDDDDDDDDTLIETVDDDEDVGDIIDKGDLEKE